MFLESIFPLTIQNVKKNIFFFTIFRQAVLRRFWDVDSSVSPAPGQRRRREGKPAPHRPDRRWARSVASPAFWGCRWGPHDFRGRATSLGCGTLGFPSCTRAPLLTSSVAQLERLGLFLRRRLGALGPRFGCKPSAPRASWAPRWGSGRQGCGHESSAAALRYCKVRDRVS